MLWLPFSTFSSSSELSSSSILFRRPSSPLCESVDFLRGLALRSSSSHFGSVRVLRKGCSESRRVLGLTVCRKAGYFFLRQRQRGSPRDGVFHIDSDRDELARDDFAELVRPHVDLEELLASLSGSLPLDDSSMIGGLSVLRTMLTCTVLRFIWKRGLLASSRVKRGYSRICSSTTPHFSS